MTDKLLQAREVLDEGRGRTRGIVPVRRDVEVVDFRELARRMAVCLERLLEHEPEWCGWGDDLEESNALAVLEVARRAGLL